MASPQADLVVLNAAVTDIFLPSGKGAIPASVFESLCLGWRNAQWLRELAVFAEDPCELTATHSSSRRSDTIFWPLLAPAYFLTDIHKYKQLSKLFKIF